MRPAVLPPEPPRRSAAVGAASLGALVTVVVVVPAWMVIHGLLPFLHLVPAGSRGGVGPSPVRTVAHLAVQVGLAAAWLCWAWVVVCVASEVRARVTGRPPTRTPGGAVHGLAAVLVGGVFAMTALTRGLDGPSPRTPTPHRPSPIAAGTSASPRPAVVEVARRRPGSRSEARQDGAAPPPGDDVQTRQVPEADERPGRADGTAADTGGRPCASHVVAPRETLWSIAERRLGGGTRWREIARINYDRPQPDGRALTGEHALAAGWVLLLPDAGPSDAGPTPTKDGPPVPTGRPPAAPIGAGIIGVGAVDLAERWRRLQRRRPEGSLADRSRALLDHVEQRLRAGDGAAELAAARAALASWSTPDPRRSGAERGQVVGVTVSDDRVTLVADRAIDGDRLPPGFVLEGGRAASIRRADLRRSVPGARRSAPGAAPTLVAIGRQADGPVTFVALGTVGPVVVEAEGAVADGLIRAMALELATSAHAEFRLLLVGFGGELTRFPHVDLLEEGDVALTATADGAGPPASPARSGVPTVVLCSPGTSAGAVDRLLRRAAAPESNLTVVGFAPPSGGSAVVGTWLDGDGLRPVLRVASPAAAALSLPGAGTPVSALSVFGHVLDPQMVSDDEVSGVLAVLDACRPGPAGAGDRAGPTCPDDIGGDPSSLEDDREAAEGIAPPPVAAWRQPSGARTSAPVSGASGLESPGRRSRRDPECVDDSAGRGPEEEERASEDQGAEIVVAVLGPVEISGAARPFTRAWAKELVVYLAVHPDGAANDTWSTALWPDRLMAPSSLHSTVSVARRALGTAADGTDHLPRSHGRLALAPSVTTDWACFVALADAGTPAAWRQALELVRGRPFAGLRDPDWALLDGTAPMIESTVVEVSGRLAGACFREGDAAGVEWAARRGLLVSPYDERLYRMLLRAADLAGNPAGVEAVMAELVRVVADEADPLASVHPSTLALYRSLSRRPVTGAAG